MNIIDRKITHLPTEVQRMGENASYILRQTHRNLTRALQEKIEPHGVSIGMWYFLRTLWVEDGLTQRELSQRVEMMEPTTATALRCMEERGLIRRVRNPTDKRKINIYLTDAGHALKDVLLPHARAVNVESLRGVEREDIEAFARVLDTMRLNLAACGMARDVFLD